MAPTKVLKEDFRSSRFISNVDSCSFGELKSQLLQSGCINSRLGAKVVYKYSHPEVDRIWGV